MDLKISHQGDWGDGLVGPHKLEIDPQYRCQKALPSDMCLSTPVLWVWTGGPHCLDIRINELWILSESLRK